MALGRSRTSRTLIGFTLAAVVLGAIAYLFNPLRSKAKESGEGAASTGPATRDAKGSGTIPDVPKGGIIIKSAGPATRAAAGDITATTKPTQLALLTTTTPQIISVGPQAPRGETAATQPGQISILKTEASTARARFGGNAVAEGRSLIDSGQLVAGRRVLNDALLSGRLSPADQQAAKELIGKANESIVFSPRRYADDPFGGTYTVSPGDRPARIAAQCDLTWDFVGRINNIPDSRKLRPGSIKVIKGPFHAVVNKATYTLDVYLGSPGEAGSMFVKQFKVGHGRNNTTPTGSWMVTPQNKLKDPKWWGTADEPARESSDPLNPLGEYWIGLTGVSGEAEGKQGFGIHGTIEPKTIGTQASHGCVRLLAEDIERVYEMLVEGKSTVVIKD